MPLVLFVLIMMQFATAVRAEAVRGSLFVSTSAGSNGTMAALFVGRSPGGMFAEVGATTCVVEHRQRVAAPLVQSSVTTLPS